MWFVSCSLTKVEWAEFGLFWQSGQIDSAFFLCQCWHNRHENVHWICIFCTGLRCFFFILIYMTVLNFIQSQWFFTKSHLKLQKCSFEHFLKLTCLLSLLKHNNERWRHPQHLLQPTTSTRCWCTLGVPSTASKGRVTPASLSQRIAQKVGVQLRSLKVQLVSRYRNNARQGSSSEPEHCYTN